jgi:hypothetical protein
LFNIREALASYTNPKSKVLNGEQLSYFIPYLESQFVFGEQGDSHEFFCSILNRLEYELTQFTSIEDFLQSKRLFNEVFGGEMISQVTCGRCKKRSRVDEAFNILSIVRNLPFDSSFLQTRLNSILRLFLTPLGHLE